MNRNLTSKDAPKVALVMGLLFVMGVAGWMKMQKSAAQQELDRAMLHMKLESGMVVAPGDENLSPEAADEAQNERQDADPNFHS